MCHNYDRTKLKMEVITISCSLFYRSNCKYAGSWTPQFPILDSTLSRLDCTFWLDFMLKLYSVRYRVGSRAEPGWGPKNVDHAPVIRCWRLCCVRALTNRQDHFVQDDRSATSSAVRHLSHCRALSPGEWTGLTSRLYWETALRRLWFDLTTAERKDERANTSTD